MYYFFIYTRKTLLILIRISSSNNINLCCRDSRFPEELLSEAFRPPAKALPSPDVTLAPSWNRPAIKLTLVFTTTTTTTRFSFLSFLVEDYHVPMIS